MKERAASHEGCTASRRAVPPLRGITWNGSAALKLSFNTSERRRLFHGGRSRESGCELIEFLIKMRSNCSGEGRIHEGGCKGMNNEIVFVYMRAFVCRMCTWGECTMRHAVVEGRARGKGAGGFIDREFITWI